VEFPSLTACASSTCNSRQIAALRSLGVNNAHAPSESDDLAVSTARWKIWKNTAHLRRKVAICVPRMWPSGSGINRPTRTRRELCSSGAS
jgi:hypothetical protein